MTWSPRTLAYSYMTALGMVALCLVAPGPSDAIAAKPTIGPGGITQPTDSPRVNTLLSEMTLDEKLSMLKGSVEAGAADTLAAGFLPGVPRLGIPSLRLSDGPPGVINKRVSVGLTDTMGVAATFDSSLAAQNGAVIGREARALGQDVVLEPFVNMDRDTSWERGFNTFGEDPLLTGNTGAAEIQGIQQNHVMAEAKHYIAYDGAKDVVVNQQALHEMYLAPFAAAVRVGVSAIMCSYNLVNGAQACGNRGTLTGILRNELGFHGFVTSDWGATHATSDINAGLDMEMGGFSFVFPPKANGEYRVDACTVTGDPGVYFCPDQLRAAIASGSVSLRRIDQAVGRILDQYDRFGLLSGGSKHTITPLPVAQDEAIVQQTGEKAAVLLRNTDSTLPLTPADLSNLALIGPGAGQTIATDGGGEKSGGLVSQQTGTYQVLQRLLAGQPDVHLHYAVADDMTGRPVPASALSHLVRTNPDGTTQPDQQIDYTDKSGHPLPAGKPYSWTGTLTAPTTGQYWLITSRLGGGTRFSVDGVRKDAGVVPRYGVFHPTDNGPLPSTDGLANFRCPVTLTAGPHKISLAAVPDSSGQPLQVRLAWVTPAQQHADHDAAVAAAKDAKAALVFAWSEGDLSRPLPDRQDQLIADVARVNPHTIVVLNTGQPVGMPWASKVKSILEMWYPGDKGGYSTANLLLGRTNPGGKLPFTWPKTLGQEVAHQPATHPERTSNGVYGVTTYSEGVDIGYRFFDAANETPLFPFGYGLSYTSFVYSDLHTARAPDGGVNVTFGVRNTGATAGDAVPQVYLGAPDSPPSGVQFAPKALAAYARVALQSGQLKTVTLHVPPRQLQYWSPDRGWTTATGTRPLMVGSDERTPALQTRIDIG